MRVSMIVAAAENNVIGRDNQLPWSLPADLKYFKQKTDGYPIIMGRKTLEALGRLLPNRTHIVITRQTDFAQPGIVVVNSPESALQKAAEHNKEEAFIIGGGEIFHKMLPLTDRVYLTRIHTTVEGDAHFPTLPAADWQLTSAERHETDAKHQYAFTFEVYDRKK